MGRVVTTTYVCDICGGEIATTNNDDTSFHFGILVRREKHREGESPFAQYQTHFLDLCERCLDKAIAIDVTVDGRGKRKYTMRKERGSCARA